MHRRVLEAQLADAADSEPLVMPMPGQGTVSAEELLDANPPPFHGFCLKKNNSFLPKIFPCWFPKWKKRFFVISGNYVFRFADRDSDVPKGVPLPLDCSQFAELEGSQFEINIIRKSYILDAGTIEKRAEWLLALKVRKLEAIRENMGHAPVCNVYIICLYNMSATFLANHYHFLRYILYTVASYVVMPKLFLLFYVLRYLLPFVKLMQSLKKRLIGECVLIIFIRLKK